jgi:hypothetical protein
VPMGSIQPGYFRRHGPAWRQANAGHVSLAGFLLQELKRSFVLRARSLAALTRSFEFSPITRASSARMLACSRALWISSSSEPVIFQAPAFKGWPAFRLPDLASARR